MSKKSEKKTKRRNNRKNRISKKRIEKKSSDPIKSKQNYLRSMMGNSVNTNIYSDCFSKLVTLFSSYNPEDLIVAISIAELWIPNISTSVRYQIAYRVLSAMGDVEFSNRRSIESYKEFYLFVDELHRTIPSNPMLEDFVPEMEWGDIKYNLNNKYYKVFYGGNIERITDFLTAFEIRYSGFDEALSNLEFTLKLQNYLISKILSNGYKNINCGHCEVPTPEFWEESKTVLSKIDGFIANESTGFDLSTLFCSLGDALMLEASSSIGDMVHNGDLFRYFGLEINGRRYLAGPRNITNVLLDIWSAKAEANTPDEFELIKEFNYFLSKRFPSNDVVAGPLKLQLPGLEYPCIFSSFLRSTGENYLITLVESKDIEKYTDMAQRIRDFSKAADRWRLLNVITGSGLEIKNSDGEYFPISDLKLVVVLSDISTGMTSVEIPDEVLLFGLPDFITIFDSFNSIDDLSRFNQYLNGSKGLLLRGFTGMADCYAAFCDSDEVLLAGAADVDYMFLDPYMGVDWRFKKLQQYWQSVPPNFPSDEVKWKCERSKEEGLYSLHSKDLTQFSWSAVIRGCVVHFRIHFDGIDNDPVNGRLLETASHCFADSLIFRCDLIKDFPVFSNKKIVISCRADTKNLAIHEKDSLVSRDLDVFSKFYLTEKSEIGLKFEARLNLNVVQANLFEATDSSFECRVSYEILRYISNLAGYECADIRNDPVFLETAGYKPRFYQGVIIRPYSVPDGSISKEPDSRHFKLARKNLAYIFKRNGVSPGRYEFSDAKVIIDEAKVAFREEIHNDIKELHKLDLLRLCIQKIDSAISDYDLKVERLSQSLNHQVDYDRGEDSKSNYEIFSKISKNYKYLLENRLYFKGEGKKRVLEEDVISCIAKIDWLFVLYGASDTLHNEIDVGGINIDDEYVPEVFYSEDRVGKENDFNERLIRNSLGVERSSVERLEPNEKELSVEALNSAFLLDTGFTIQVLIDLLTILADWVTYSGMDKPEWQYEATIGEIVSVFRSNVLGSDDTQITNAINFLILDPENLRKIIGKEDGIEEADIPVWEHFYRGSRYNIRPLLNIRDDLISWGSASVFKAKSIWSGNITSGYLPAGYEWGNVNHFVDGIKVSLETKLEKLAFNVFKRNLEHSFNNIDFKRRFKSEKFDDVGDFDVLVYVPNSNTLISVECKYNKPPRCMKDMKKLRELVFTKRKSHINKIERRHRFLEKNSNRIFELLDIPRSVGNAVPKVISLYVTKDSYWWMVNPPQDIEFDVEFEQIDFLESWLNNYLSVDDNERGLSVAE